MKTVIVGAGGQARVIFDILRHDRNIEVVGFTDLEVRDPHERILGLPILGPHRMLEVSTGDYKAAIVAIGDNKIRSERFAQLRQTGLKLVNAIHPTAIISPTATIGEGCMIGPGAKIGTMSTIGDNCIINTGAIIEHEAEIGDHAHIAPASVILGRARVGVRTFIGAGSVVKELTRVGSDAVIGAGSVVLEDMPDDVMAAGAPATVRRTKTSNSAVQLKPR